MNIMSVRKQLVNLEMTFSEFLEYFCLKFLAHNHEKTYTLPHLCYSIGYT